MRRSLLLVVLILGLLPIPAAAQEDAEPQEPTGPTMGGVVLPAIADLGQEVKVESDGWPATTPVSVSICGNLALRGGEDCDLANGVSTVSDIEGNVAAFITVTEPPSPCPCTVHLQALGALERMDIAININGVEEAEVVRPPTESIISLLEVSAELQGNGPWTAWFGAAPERNLVITMTNFTTRTIVDPPIIVKAGRDPLPTELVPVDQGLVPQLTPGQTVSIEVPVTFPAPAWGEYYVTGEVGVFPDIGSFAETTAQYAWGAVVALILLLQWPILKIRNRIRRRLEESIDEEAAEAEVDDLGIVEGVEDELAGVGAAAGANAGVAAAAGAGLAAAAVLAGDADGPPVVPIALRRNGARGVPVIIETPITGPNTPESKVTIVVDASVEGEAPKILGVTVAGDAKAQVEIVESTGGTETALDDVVVGEIESDGDDGWGVKGIDDEMTEVRLENDPDEDSFKGFFARHTEEAGSA